MPWEVAQMKTLLATVAISGCLAGPVLAAAEDASKTESLPDFEYCKMLELLARKHMTARQKGVPMVKLYEIAQNSAISKKMVIDAFKRPRYSTEEMQQGEIDDFANTYFAACLQAMDDKDAEAKK